MAKAAVLVPEDKGLADNKAGQAWRASRSVELGRWLSTGSTQGRKHSSCGTCLSALEMPGSTARPTRGMCELCGTCLPWMGNGNQKRVYKQALKDPDLIDLVTSVWAPTVLDNVKIKRSTVRQLTFLFQDISWSKMRKMSLSRAEAEAGTGYPLFSQGLTTEPAWGTGDPRL